MNIRKPVFFLLLVMSVCRGEQIFDDDVVFNGSVSVPTSTVAAQAVNNTRLLSVSNALQSAIDDVVTGATDWGDIGGTLADQTDLQNALDLKATLSALVTESGRIDTAEADIVVLETTTAKKNQSNVFLGGNDYFGSSASTNGHVRLFTDATDGFVNINRKSSQDEALLGFFAGGSGVWTLGPRAYPARSPEPDAFLINHSPTGASGYFFWVSTNGTVHAKTDFVAGGSISGNGVGITNLVSSNLTGTIPAARLPDSNAARAALGLSIGSDVLALDGDGSSLTGVTPSPTNQVSATAPASTNFTLAVVYAQSITLAADSGVIVPSVPTNRLVELQVDVNGADTYGLVWDPAITWLTDPPTGAAVPVYLRRTTGTTNWVGVAFQ